MIFCQKLGEQRHIFFSRYGLSVGEKRLVTWTAFNDHISSQLGTKLTLSE